MPRRLPRHSPPLPEDVHKSKKSETATIRTLQVEGDHITVVKIGMNKANIKEKDKNIGKGGYRDRQMSLEGDNMTVKTDIPHSDYQEIDEFGHVDVNRSTSGRHQDVDQNSIGTGTSSYFEDVAEVLQQMRLKEEAQNKSTQTVAKTGDTTQEKDIPIYAKVNKKPQKPKQSAESANRSSTEDEIPEYAVVNKKLKKPKETPGIKIEHEKYLGASSPQGNVNQRENADSRPSSKEMTDTSCDDESIPVYAVVNNKLKKKPNDQTMRENEQEQRSSSEGIYDLAQEVAPPLPSKKKKKNKDNGKLNTSSEDLLKPPLPPRSPLNSNSNSPSHSPHLQRNPRRNALRDHAPSTKPELPAKSPLRQKHKIQETISPSGSSRNSTDSDRPGSKTEETVLNPRSISIQKRDGSQSGANKNQNNNNGDDPDYEALWACRNSTTDC